MLRTLLLLLGLVAAAAARDRPHVYLVIVDGMDDRFATEASWPTVHGLLDRDPGLGSFLHAHAIMPTRTNSNHVTLLTGFYPQVHGVTGNTYWPRRRGVGLEKFDDPALIETETLFTVAETDEPDLVTMGVFAKPKLGRLFAAAPDRQRAPDVLWSGADAAPGERDGASGYASDAATMRVFLERAAAREPDLAVVNIADVDRTGHAHGPDSAECAAAVRAADAQIGRLVDDLRARGRWERSVVLVTGDHGFDAVAPGGDRPDPLIALGPALERAGVRGITLVADGGVEHVYANAVRAESGAVGESAATLARVAGVARETPGVAEVLARLPVPDVPALARAHPDWHLQHQRTGELLLVAARGYQFIDGDDPGTSQLVGNHGGPGERPVPLVILGGYPGIAAVRGGEPLPTAADVGATIATLAGLRLPRRLDGREVAEGLAGRPIRGLLKDHTAGSTP